MTRPENIILNSRGGGLKYTSTVNIYIYLPAYFPASFCGFGAYLWAQNLTFCKKWADIFLRKYETYLLE